MMGALDNVGCVGSANLVLASDTPTTPVQADRDVTPEREYNEPRLPLRGE